MEAPNQHSPARGASDELALAASLYAAVTSGHERLGYNVSGTFALWSRGPGGRGWQPAPGAETVPRGDWRPCLEVLPDGSTRPRRFNPWAMREHVRGRYYVAPQAPSWVGWLAFDLDAHVAAEILADTSDEVIPLGAVHRALAARDAALGELWRALSFGPGREPVLIETPGQGLHAYLPLTRGPVSPHEHTWPAAWVLDWTATVLRRRGVALEPGRIELYPSGRPLRAPCGGRMFVLEATRPDRPDDLGLVRIPGTTTTRVRRRGELDDVSDAGVELARRPWAQVAAFLGAWERSRRPLEAWLGEERAAWCPVRGPFVLPDRAVDPGQETPVLQKNGGVGRGRIQHYQNKDEVPGRAGGRLRSIASGAVEGAGSRSDPDQSARSLISPSPSGEAPPAIASERVGVLRRGREFRAHLARLLRQGVTTPGTRHDAVLSLVFGWHVQGRTEDEVRVELEAWARAHPHVSKLKGERFVRQCLREGMHYYHRIKKLPQRARSFAATVARTRALSPADHLVIAKVRPEVREEAWAILEYLHGHADAGGVVADPVLLGRAQLDALMVADRRIAIEGRGRACRAEVEAVRELERLGVLALHVDYSRGHHGRVFTCWYAFGSGVLPMPHEPGTRGAPRPHQLAQDGRSRVGGGEPLVLAERRVREGVLRVVSDGTRRVPQVEIEPAAGATTAADVGGSSWWRQMYERRRFTVRDLRGADEGVVIAGPWRAPPPWAVARYGAPVEELPYGKLAPSRGPQAPASAPAHPIANPAAVDRRTRK